MARSLRDHATGSQEREPRSARTRDGRGADAVVGIDVGGTKILGIVRSADGGVLARVRRKTPVGGNAALAAAVAELVGELLEQAAATDRTVTGIGVAAPGFIDSRSGVIVDASNLGVRDLPLTGGLADRFGLPVRLVHDVRAATVAEATFGAGAGVANFAYVNIGTGVAAGFIFGHRLYTGTSGKAGELGHVVVDPSGPACTCGKRGCLEAFASGAALDKLAAEATEAHPGSLLARSLATRRQERGHVAALAKAASEGDALAAKILSQATSHLGLVVAGLVDTLALERVVIGGGLGRLRAEIFEPLRGVALGAVLEANRAPRLITMSALGADVGAIGAALAARRGMEPVLEEVT
ncbi:MAG: ROK family protein [Trueperaceae bacterium]|nr:ROK family protein [Trueperaceae bacterium]MCW5820978.1 ROK family protein [Trueperaceae bacterium]